MSAGSDDCRLSAEYDKMRQGIVAAVAAWAGLENALADLLGSLISDSPGLGLVIYYTPSNIETRLSLLDNTVSYASPYLHEGARFEQCWSTICKRIYSAKDTRNKIVHGNISTVTSYAKQHCRLTYPVFDFTKRNRDRATQIEGLRKGGKALQLPGMSAADVHNAAASFSSLGEACHTLSGIITTARYGDDPQRTWHDRLLQLEADLTTQASRTRAPKIPIHRPTATGRT